MVYYRSHRESCTGIGHMAWDIVVHMMDIITSLLRYRSLVLHPSSICHPDWSNDIYGIAQMIALVVMSLSYCHDIGHSMILVYWLGFVSFRTTTVMIGKTEGVEVNILAKQTVCASQTVDIHETALSSCSCRCRPCSCAEKTPPNPFSFRVRPSQNLQLLHTGEGSTK